MIRNKTLKIAFFLITMPVLVVAQKNNNMNHYSVKVATLSNGKYNEFVFSKPTEDVGGVLYNTRTGKLIGFAPDETDSMHTPVPAEYERWLSIDPLAEKYYSISPYAFCLNNPIKYVDPDGREVWISFGTGFLGLGKKQEVKYEGGALYNKDGTAYAGKVKGFLKSSLDGLNSVRSSKEGGLALEGLESSRNVFTVKRGSNSFVTNNSAKSSGNLSEVQAVTGNAASSSGAGGIIFWNPSSTEGGLSTTGTRSRPPYIGLGHELFHGRDSDQGLLYPSEDYTNALTGIKYYAKYMNLKKSEWRAAYYENVMRGQMGIPLRTQYGVEETENGGVNPSGPNLLDNNGSPINYPAK